MLILFIALIDFIFLLLVIIINLVMLALNYLLIMFL